MGELTAHDASQWCSLTEGCGVEGNPTWRGSLQYLTDSFCSYPP